MTTGLTLGKYAPLHRGHQRLIERALAENDDVIVLVYDAPEVATRPLAIRAGWIRRLHPRAEVIECRNAPLETGADPLAMRLQEEYILRVLGGRRITRFYSSEFYGEHVSRALGAIDCRVDPDRTAIPISGTLIRANPYLHRRHLDPLVYRDLLTKVVLLGAPGTGKTTLATALAERHRTVWMPEYGREYWERHQVGRRLSLEQVVEIAEGHIAREDRLVIEADRVFFVDTDATTTWLFSHYYHGTAHPRLDALAAATIDRYDLFVLCGDDIPFDDTWDRSGAVQRETMQILTRADLRRRGIPFREVTGSLEARVATVSQWVSEFDRFPPGSHRRIE